MGIHKHEKWTSLCSKITLWQCEKGRLYVENLPFQKRRTSTGVMGLKKISLSSR